MYKYFWDRPILRYSLYRSMLIFIFPCLKGLLMKAEIKENTGVTYSIRDNHLDILVLLTSLIPAMPVSSSKPSATFNTFLRPHPATPAFFVVTVSLPLLCSLCHSFTNTVEGASRDYNERGTEGIKVRENGGRKQWARRRTLERNVQWFPAHFTVLCNPAALLAPPQSAALIIITALDHSITRNGTL